MNQMCPFSLYFACQPIKRKTKIAALFYFYLLKKIRLDVLCASSALQRIHMNYQVLFSLKNNEEIFMNVVCCSCDRHFKVRWE